MEELDHVRALLNKLQKEITECHKLLDSELDPEDIEGKDLYEKIQCVLTQRDGAIFETEEIMRHWSEANASDLEESDTVLLIELAGDTRTN